MTKNHSKRIFIYRVDASDNIIFVNDAWLSFARENDAHHLSKSKVLNQSLWDFIVDRETRHLYSLMLSKVRAGTIGVKVPFRCDAPDCRRFMEMEILPLPQDSVEFRSRILALEPRDHTKILKVGTDRSGEFIHICSWCKKIHVPKVGWFEVEEAVDLLGLFDVSKIPQLTHGMCLSCRESLSQKV